MMPKSHFFEKEFPKAFREVVEWETTANPDSSEDERGNLARRAGEEQDNPGDHRGRGRDYNIRRPLSGDVG